VIFSNPITGHRGAAGLAPENTLMAIEAGANNGASAVEIDVTLLADHTVVVHHDAGLGRCMEGVEKLEALVYSDLATISAIDATHLPIAAGIPTLVDALRVVDSLGIGINIEIKNHGFSADLLVDKVLTVLNQWGRTESCLISSFDLDVLKELHGRNQGWRLGWITEFVPDHWAEIAQATSLYSIHVCEQAVDQAWVDQAKALGLCSFVWTVNDPDVASKLLSWGVDGIITDYPNRISSLWKN
jgi:glycerophosphoryl diester phosphodiesterase